jgi:hypothetical protein
MNEKTLQEVLKENKERYNQRLKTQREQIKKEQRKELIIVSIASILILTLTFKTMIDTDRQRVQKCVEKGYSQVVCEYVVG